MTWRRRSRVLAVLVAVVLPFAAAWAATVPVRSGEHGAFTRLVFYLPVGTDWTLAQIAPDAVRLDLGGGGHGFDLQQAFSRIGRERVAALEQPAPSRLVVRLGCACGARGFVVGDRMLVVDIGPDLPTPTPLVAPEASDDVPAAQVQGVDPPQTHDLAALPLLPDPGDGVGRGVLSDRLAAELAAAAAAGLLGAQSGVNVRDPFSPHRTPPAEVAAPDTPADGPEQAYCPRDAATLTQLWAGPDPFSETLSRLRSATVSATGQVDPAAVLALARFQISQGMGFEALAALRGTDGAEPALLRAMAGLIEARGNVSPRAFAGCDGLILWEALRRARGGVGGEGLDDTALVEGYRGLSATLQRMVETELLRFLSDTGHLHAYDALKAFVARTQAGPAGDQPQSPGSPLEAVTTGSHDIPRALLARFADMSLAVSAPVADRALVPTFLIEYRGTALEPDFQAALVRMYLAEARVPEALAALRDLRSRHPAMFDGLYAEVAVHVTRTVSDVGFLRMALSAGAPDGLPHLPAAAAEEAAQRLSGLGF